jgi:hypothetical protein
MKHLIHIKSCQNNLAITYKENGRCIQVTVYSAGLDGEFSRQDWRESEEIITMFDQKDQELILDALAMYGPTPFFKEKAGKRRQRW